jgi:2-polyprenyl-6-methoxyphenol hydroxylase-like FAD-dependent oxidoreductase
MGVALRAVVVGGGIGGIAAAVALAQAGIDVQVREQAQQHLPPPSQTVTAALTQSQIAPICTGSRSART